MFLTPVVIEAVYVVQSARPGTGIKVAVLPEEVTVPEIGVLPCINLNVELLTVAGFIASLKVAVIVVFAGTFCTLPGLVEITVGAVAPGVGVGAQAAPSVMASIIITDTLTQAMFPFLTRNLLYTRAVIIAYLIYIFSHTVS